MIQLKYWKSLTKAQKQELMKANNIKVASFDFIKICYLESIKIKPCEN